MNKLFKEILFLILFVAILITIVGILFYEYIPTSILPKSEEYSQSESTAMLISQINTDGENKKENTEESVLKSYELTADDLSIYTQSQVYDSGKANPFYDNLKSTENNIVNEEPTEIENNEEENNVIEDEKTEMENESSDTDKKEVALAEDKEESKELQDVPSTPISAVSAPEKQETTNDSNSDKTGWYSNSKTK